MRRLKRNLLPDPWMPREFWPEILAYGAPPSATYQASTWPTADRAFYLPFVLPCDARIYAVRARGTNTTGNYDIGLYDEYFRRIASKGSTANANAALELSVDLQLCGGRMYWMALVMSSTSSGVIRATEGSVNRLVFAGLTQEDSALPLPATATPVDIASDFVPMMVLGIR